MILAQYRLYYRKYRKRQKLKEKNPSYLRGSWTHSRKRETEVSLSMSLTRDSTLQNTISQSWTVQGIEISSRIWSQAHHRLTQPYLYALLKMVSSPRPKNIYSCKNPGYYPVDHSNEQDGWSNYDKARFDVVKADLSALLKMVVISRMNILFIPTSAFKGDNLAKPSENTKWYKDPHCSRLLIRLNCQRNHNITTSHSSPGRIHHFRYRNCSSRRVETGVMKPGDKIIFMPAKAVVK